MVGGGWQGRGGSVCHAPAPSLCQEPVADFAYASAPPRERGIQEHLEQPRRGVIRLPHPVSSFGPFSCPYLGPLPWGGRAQGPNVVTCHRQCQGPEPWPISLLTRPALTSAPLRGTPSAALWHYPPLSGLVGAKGG